MGQQAASKPEERALTSFERFLLAIPSNTLYKLSYAWFGVVIFFDWAPVVSALLALCLIVRVVVPKIQRRIWESKMVRECENDQQPYVDRPRLPLARQGLNLALALVASGLLAYLLDGALGLPALEWALLVAGFFIFQMDARLFGDPTVYIVTGEGVAIITSNLRLYLEYDEIEQALVVEGVETPSARWAILAPSRTLNRGVLLVPRARDGFTRLIDHVALAPSDPEEFMLHIPSRLKALGGES
jgi:hypothetical protein